VTQSAVMIRKAAILEVGGYDEHMRFSEDYDLWLRIAVQYPLIALRDATARRRHHPGQATWKNMSPLYTAKWRLRLGLFDCPALSHDPDRRRLIAHALKEAVSIDYGLTWRDLDATSFAIVDDAASQIPDASRVRRTWRIRKLLFWHAWLLAVKARRALRGRSDTLGKEALAE
jgi:hypothetical protein